MKPTLLVLAAGMGSRYGSLKQMDGIGPGGEAIIDYSIYDAIRAGFGKVVFVIRHAFEKDFREVFTPERFGGKIEVDFVFQELDKLPEGYTVPEGREKPWGTNHAVLMAKDTINTPFAVINADDFYGKDSYQQLGDYLRSLEGKSGSYCMVGFQIQNTLSENGSVSRGECGVDAEGNLVVENGDEKIEGCIATRNYLYDFDFSVDVKSEGKDCAPIWFHAFIPKKGKEWGEIAGWKFEIPEEKLSLLKKGDWNNFRITVKEGKVNTYINGEAVAEFTDEKLNTVPGRILMQVKEGAETKALYKNFKIANI